MPILDPDLYTAPAQDAPVQIASPTYKGVAVDTQVTPVSKLLTAIEGMAWTITYYSQVLGTDSSTTGQGTSTPAALQQYREIRNLEVRVQTPLTAAQDQTTKEISYTGAAIVYPFVIPNEGDMFRADVGDGREGIFQITTVNRRAIYRQTCHDIEYKMIAFTQEDDPRLADLQSKVIKSFVFVKDFITYGQNPLLFESEFDDYQYLKHSYSTILATYLRSFYSREYDTVILPGQSFATYDPYLMKALVSFFESTDGEAMYRARLLNVEDDQASRAAQIWEVLLARDINLIPDCFQRVGTVNANSYSYEPLYDGIAFSGIQKVVYPLDPTLTVDYNRTLATKVAEENSIAPGPKALTPSAAAQGSSPSVQDFIARTAPGFQAQGEQDQGILIPPFINHPLLDGYYVFSKAFYERSQVPGEMSVIELLVWDYLEGKALNHGLLRQLCEDVRNWTALDKFYLVPVLLVLVRVALRGM